jgi:hypothetical protein
MTGMAPDRCAACRPGESNRIEPVVRSAEEETIDNSHIGGTVHVIAEAEEERERRARQPKANSSSLLLYRPQ